MRIKASQLGMDFKVNEGKLYKATPEDEAEDAMKRRQNRETFSWPTATFGP